MSGPVKEGKFSVRFKTDLRGENSEAMDIMANAQTLYDRGRWGEFLTQAERALAEFPFANRSAQRSLNDKIAEINKTYGALSREAHAMITDYKEFSDLQSLDRAEWPVTSVYRVMTPFAELRTASPEDGLMKVLQVMGEADVSQVAVVDGNLLLGMISHSDILNVVRVRREVGVDG